MLRGLWRRGSVLEGRVQVRGGVRWPHALPTWVRGREGGGFHLATSSSYGPAALPGVRPGILARQPFHGCGPPTRRFLPGPTRTPACMHGGRDRSPEERRSRPITAAVMRLHSLQVCLITRRQPWLFKHPSSLTHPLQSGAWWRAAIKGRGVLIIRGGGSWLVTVYINTHTYSTCIFFRKICYFYLLNIFIYNINYMNIYIYIDM